VLRGAAITISMDGKGRCIDNVFVERVWRSLKYEEVFLHAYEDLDEARAALAGTSNSTTSFGRTRLSATRRQMPSTVASRSALREPLLKHRPLLPRNGALRTQASVSD